MQRDDKAEIAHLRRKVDIIRRDRNQKNRLIAEQNKRIAHLESEIRYLAGLDE